MKFTQKYLSITAAVIGLTLLNSCADRFLAEVPYPNDITFNEIALDRFSYEIPDGPFEVVGDTSSDVITVNVAKEADGTYSGFALSNKNFRSFPWDLTAQYGPVGGLSPAETQEAINTTAFSVYTSDVNRTENYLVGNTNNDNAYFTLSEPSTIEHILVANTTYNNLLARYGSIYSRVIDSETQMYVLEANDDYDIEDLVRENVNIDNTEREAVYTLPGLDGTLNTVRLSGSQTLAKNEVGVVAGEEAGNAVGGKLLAETEADAAAVAKITGWTELDTADIADPAAKTKAEADLAAYIINFPASTPEEQQAAYDAAYAAEYAVVYAAEYDGVYDDLIDSDYDRLYEGYFEDSAYYVAYETAYDLATESITDGDVTLTIEGFLNGASVGTLDVYLSLLVGADIENPEYGFNLYDWEKVDLTSLGQVDKVLFKMSSSYVNPDGTMVYPPTFCLDGIRLQQ